jgi:hypothetical protein
MLTMFRNGGFSMFFILAFGLIALATAFIFALRPRADREGFLRFMSLATLYSILSGTCGDLAAVADYVVTHEMDGRKMAATVIEGVGESMSPGILGFSLLSLVALMTAVGKRRLAAREPTLANERS